MNEGAWVVRILGRDYRVQGAKNEGDAVVEAAHIFIASLTDAERAQRFELPYVTAEWHPSEVGQTA